MEELVRNEFWILPKPKYIEINPKENGITLSSLWTIYVNKYRIKDNALLLSSKFNKHFNTFLNTIPIRDSTLDEKLEDKYYLAVVTSESQYKTQIKRNMNELLEKHISRYEEIQNKCCFDLDPNKTNSSLPLDESYYLNISKGVIFIISTSPRGFYYGIQSLVQIVEHSLFQIENQDEFIILPSMILLDFPELEYRGISIDLKTFRPTIESLNEFIPFLAKYKFNHIVLVDKTGFPYSEEEKKFRDLCNFHRINFSFVTNLEQLEKKNIKIIHYHEDGSYFLPDYLMTLKNIAQFCDSLSDTSEGFLISTPNGRNYPLDLMIPYLPIISDMFWNPKAPTTLKRWIKAMGSTHLNLFEDSLQKSMFDFRKMTYFSSRDGKNRSMDTLLKELNDMKKRAYENSHLLDILEWGFQTRELTHMILKLKENLESNNPNGKRIEDIPEKLEKFSETYSALNTQVIKILETTNRVQRGECHRYFQTHNSNLKTLVESWIPEYLKKISSN